MNMSKMRETTIFDVYEFSVLNVFKVSIEIFLSNKKLFAPLFMIFIYLLASVLIDRLLVMFFIPNGLISKEIVSNPIFVFAIDMISLIFFLGSLTLLIVMTKMFLYDSNENLHLSQAVDRSIRIFPKIFISYLILTILVGGAVEILNSVSMQIDGSIRFVFVVVILFLYLVFVGVIYLLPIVFVFNEGNFINSLERVLKFVKMNFWKLIGIYIFNGLVTFFLLILFGVVITSITSISNINLTFTYISPFNIYNLNLIGLVSSTLSTGIGVSILIVGLSWGYYKESKFLS